MKFKALVSVILSLIAILGGIYLNFTEFTIGRPNGEIKNLIVTIAYVVIWIFALTIGIRSKNYKTKKYFYVFWIATLFFSVVTICVNAAGITAVWAVPFVTLLLSQWYGLSFFTNNFVIIAIIIAIISFIVISTIKLMSKDTD